MDIKVVDPLGCDTEPTSHNGNHQGSDIEGAIDNRDKKSVGPVHACGICGMNFKLKDLLTAHHQVHTGQENYKCKDCGKDFAQFSHLNQHERTHKHGKETGFVDAVAEAKEGDNAVKEDQVLYIKTEQEDDTFVDDVGRTEADETTAKEPITEEETTIKEPIAVYIKTETEDITIKEEDDPFMVDDKEQEGDDDDESEENQTGFEPQKKKARLDTYVFSDKQVVSLVEWYRDNECFYNKNAKSHKDTQRNKRLMEEKAASLDPPCTYDQLHTFIENMLTSYGKIANLMAGRGSEVPVLNERDQLIYNAFPFLDNYTNRYSGHQFTKPGTKLFPGSWAGTEQRIYRWILPRGANCEVEVNPYEISASLEEDPEYDVPSSPSTSRAKSGRQCEWCGVLYTSQSYLSRHVPRCTKRHLAEYQAINQLHPSGPQPPTRDTTAPDVVIHPSKPDGDTIAPDVQLCPSAPQPIGRDMTASDVVIEPPGRKPPDGDTTAPDVLTDPLRHHSPTRDTTVSDVQLHSSEPKPLAVATTAPSEQYSNEYLLVKRADRQFSCKHCIYRFKTRLDLERHAITHSEEKPYACTKCSFRTARTDSLSIHMMVHTDEKPHECPVCQYRCRERSSLRNHMLIHTGEKPFECAVCGAVFRQKAHWKDHTLIHSGEKPFTCGQCGAKFRHRSACKRHTLKQHGQKQSQTAVNEPPID